MQLLYAKAGQKYEDDMFEVGGRINVKRNITLTYLQIPISYKFTTLKSERIKLVLHGGPLIGIALSKKDEIKLDNVLKNDTSFSVKEKFKNIDFGFQLGLGINININKNFYVPISFTAYYGFVDINGAKTKDIDWYSKNDIKYQRSHNFRAGLTAGICYVFTGSKYYRFKH